jgi:DNA-binding NarL/FixJ family response regulator
VVSIGDPNPMAPREKLEREPDLTKLSARECEVLKLVAEGMSNSAIASALRLSEHTVKRHVANILMKLDLPTRAAAAVLADKLPA